MKKDIRYIPCYDTTKEWENRIQEVRVEEGLSISELAKLVDISVAALYSLICGYTSPTYRHSGKIKPWIESIAVILNTTVEYLFPREICPIDNPERKELTDDQLIDITVGRFSRIDHLNDRDLRCHLYKLIVDRFWNRKLKINENIETFRNGVNIIICRFYYEMTLEETKEALGIRSKERIRQLEAKILRHMRHPVFSRKIEDYK